MTMIVHLGLYDDFQRAQRITQELKTELDVNLANVTILVKRDDPGKFKEYQTYFSENLAADESDEQDDDSVLEKLNPFSGDDEDDTSADISKLPQRNMTILFIRNEEQYDVDKLKELLQKHNPIELVEEGEDAWLDTGWLGDADKPEEVQAGDENIQDRRYRSFDWDKGEQM